MKAKRLDEIIVACKQNKKMNGPDFMAIYPVKEILELALMAKKRKEQVCQAQKNLRTVK